MSKEWLLSLSPGDTVRVLRRRQCVASAVVERVTPTLIVAGGERYRRVGVQAGYHKTDPDGFGWSPRYLEPGEGTETTSC